MASDQVEYCGGCPHYEECLARIKEGKLQTCKLATERRT